MDPKPKAKIPNPSSPDLSPPILLLLKTFLTILSFKSFYFGRPYHRKNLLIILRNPEGSTMCGLCLRLVSGDQLKGTSCHCLQVSSHDLSSRAFLSSTPVSVCKCRGKMPRHQVLRHCLLSDVTFMAYEKLCRSDFECPSVGSWKKIITCRHCHCCHYYRREIKIPL